MNTNAASPLPIQPEGEAPIDVVMEAARRMEEDPQWFARTLSDAEISRDPDAIAQLHRLSKAARRLKPANQSKASQPITADELADMIDRDEIIVS